MGYHISILRTEPIEGQEISEALNRLGIGFYEESSRSATLWTERGEAITLFLQDGELCAKGVNSAALKAMLSLASSLNARLRGDELETYRSETDTYLHPDDENLLKDSETVRLHHLNRAKRRKQVANVLRGIALLALIAGLLAKAFYQP